MKPTRLVLVHHVQVVLFVLLLISGISLYVPTFRTMFNEWKIPLVAIHIWIAFFYIVLLLSSLASIIKYAWKRPSIKKFNVYFNSLLFFIWLTTGVLMYFHYLVPPVVRNTSVLLHDWATWIAIPWVLVHSVGHLFKKQIPWPRWWRSQAKKPVWITENRLERRDFLKSLVVLTVFICIGGWIRWLSPILSLPNAENKKRGYFRIYNVTNDYPRYNDQEWSLTIDGLVDKQITLTLKDMREIPWQSIIDDFHCVTGWSVTGVEMRGVYVKDLFEHFSIKTNEKYVTAYSGDGVYSDTFTLSQLIDEEAMLVFEMDGIQLKHAQGYPCRLYHPTMYGFKSVKWLDRMTVTKEREYGYWQKNGDYDLNGYL